MCRKQTLILTLIVTWIGACSNSPSTNIDMEPALAVLGGAVLGTQNDAIVARVSPPRKKTFFEWIPEAFAAAPACPPITSGSCSGSVLTVFYDNCQPSGPSRVGYWRSNISYSFPTALDCTNTLATGFNAAGIAALIGKTVVRKWGGGSQAQDQLNMRSAADQVVAYMYSDFPSGWQDNRTGGVEVTFQSATERRVIVKGVHALGVKHPSDPVTNPSAFDLTELPTSKAEDDSVERVWDHTINTVQAGDTLLAIGQTVSLNGSNVSFGSASSNTRASFNGDIVINSNTVAPGAQFRVQHNISRSIGIVTVVSPLVYSDPNCCYPTSGEVRAVYDLSLRVPTVEERLTFTGASCGQARYTTSVVRDSLVNLSHCL